MSLPRFSAAVIRWCVPGELVEGALGDLEEVHRERLERRGRWLAALLTSVESIELAGATVLMRLRNPRAAPMSWVDLKLGLRMLVEYPGLTLIGGLAMAFGIFAGAGCYEFYSQVVHPTLPFDEGDRVVMVELLDDRTGELDPRVLHDFAEWRDGLSTVEDGGAAQPQVPNLVVGGGQAATIRAAAMAGSAFRMTRVAPLLGRTLGPADESPTAPGGDLAFWIHTSVSRRTVAYAAVLTVLAAVIAGAVPGMMITSCNVASRLRRSSAGGGGLRLTGLWTAVIVVQVAVTVTFPAVGWFVRQEAVNIRSYELPFATEEYLATRPRLNRSTSTRPSGGTGQSAYAARFARTLRNETERLEAEPWVEGVTMTGNVPGTYHDWRRIELDEGGETPRTELDEKGPGRWVAGGVVAPGFFEVLGAEAIGGRTFNADDTGPEARTVVDNQSFVDHVLGDRNPIGRRLRYLESSDRWDGVELGDEPGPWYRIVGVVPDLGMSNVSGGSKAAGFYHAVSAQSLRASWLLVQVRGPAQPFEARLRAVAADVEPDLALPAVGTLDSVKEGALRAYRYWMWLIVGVSGLAVLLSLAGIYSAMAFAVARRTREIGGRVARAIFRRPLKQVAGGLLLGFLIVGLLTWGIDAQGLWGKPLVALLRYGALMTAVCSVAGVVPMRRALGVEPSEALAADG